MAEINLSNPQSVVVEMDYEGDNLSKPIKPIESEITEDQVSEDQQDHSEDDHNNESSDASDEPESLEEQKPPRSKRWEKERRAREEKYLLSKALAEERQRNLELQTYLSHSVDNNTINQADKAMRDLEAAEYAHAAALEQGDSLAAARASTALIKANMAVERAVNSKIYSNKEQEQPEIDPVSYASNNLLNGWINDNPEFNEDSPYFNEDLVSKVAPIIDRFDAKLKRQGQAHLISSPKYFDAIDALVSQAKSGKRYNRPMTASVSSRSNYQPYNNSRVILTEQQKMVAAGCNMSEEQYANWLKKYDQQKNQQQDSRGMYGY